MCLELAGLAAAALQAFCGSTETRVILRKEFPSFPTSREFQSTEGWFICHVFQVKFATLIRPSSVVVNQGLCSLDPLARAHQPQLRSRSSRWNPGASSHTSECIFSEPPLHCALWLQFLLVGFWFQVVIPGQMLIPISGCWPLVWLSGSWFLAMNIRFISQFWTQALTFGLDSPCSSL